MSARTQFMSDRHNPIEKPADRNIHLAVGHLPKAVIDLVGVYDSGSVVISRDTTDINKLVVLCTVLPEEFIIESQSNEVIELYNAINGRSVPTVQPYRSREERRKDHTSMRVVTTKQGVRNGNT